MSLRIFAPCTLAWMAALSVSHSALAQGNVQEPEIGEPIVAADAENTSDGVFTFTPRLFYNWTNLNVPSTSVSEQISRSTLQVLSYGGTLQVQPEDLQWSFSLTGLYGQGEGELYGTSGGLNINGEYEVARGDIEVLARYQFEGMPAYAFIGARYVYFDLDDTLGGGVVYSATGKNTNNEQIDTVAIEAGGGVSGPLNADASLTYFSTALVGYAYATSESENGSFVTDSGGEQWGPMGDLSAGVSYRIAKSASVSLRYRASVFPVNYASDTETFDFWVTHGVEVGVSFRF